MQEQIYFTIPAADHWAWKEK